MECILELCIDMFFYFSFYTGALDKSGGDNIQVIQLNLMK